MKTIVVSELPKEVKLWFEGWLKRELKPADQIVAFASSPNESENFHQHYQSMHKLSSNRLEGMAAKMKGTGFDENDIYCALHGGLQKGESFFQPRPKTKKEKQVQRTSAVSQ